MDERSRRTGFSLTCLDRSAEKRSDAAWITKARQSGHYLLFLGDRPLFRALDGGSALRPLFDRAQAESLAADCDRAIFLGQNGEAAFFAVQVPFAEDPPEGLKAIDMRSVAVQGLVAPELLGPMAQAKSMLDWHARNTFCPSCAAPTRVTDAGYCRRCESCGGSQFPRTDPVVIMLVIDGEDCLLARAPRFQPGMYSALAGFVEPGETIEDAVRREVKEEAGIATDRVAYHSSQPWPFPSSLMIGCFARAATRELVIDRTELEHGRWFSRTEVEEMLNMRHPDGLFTPPPMAVAHQLLKSYVAGEAIP